MGNKINYPVLQLEVERRVSLKNLFAYVFEITRWVLVRTFAQRNTSFCLLGSVVPCMKCLVPEKASSVPKVSSTMVPYFISCLLSSLSLTLFISCLFVYLLSFPSFQYIHCYCCIRKYLCTYARAVYVYTCARAFIYS